MAVFELANLPEYGPYSAVIGTDGYTFDVRIEPPFIPGEAILEAYQDDGVNYRLFTVDRNATTLHCFMNDEHRTEIQNVERLKQITGSLLKELGKVSSKESFIKANEKYIIRED